MTRFILSSLLFAVGCGYEGKSSAPDANQTSDGLPSNDAAAGCAVFLTFDPPSAIAGPDTQIRVAANVLNAAGVLGYTWQVRLVGQDVPFAFAQADQSAVTFAAPVAGPYDVLVGVDAPADFCPTAQGGINVGVAGGNVTQVRLRVTPPTSIAAPNEKLVLVTGGASFSLNDVSIDPGFVATGQVQASATGVQAFLRFIPLGGRDAYVETFSSSSGAFSARMLNQIHDVLVVPLVPGFAPKLYVNWVPGQIVPVEPGNTVDGIVRGPAGGALAGAKVQLSINGVPTTLTTTAANGTFQVRRSTASVTGATVAIDVTPPVGTGLPRLSASSGSLDLGAQVQINYAALATRDVGGATVRRGGAPQGGAKVAIVGGLASAGTVIAGASANATGEVRIAATANGAGALPAGTLAPAVPLSAVSALSNGDIAVDPGFDLTSAVPATINAPAMVPKTLQIREPMGTAIGKAEFEAVPVGALGMAGIGYTRATTDGAGMTSTTLASGAHYQLRIFDPVGRGSQLVIDDVLASAVAGAYTLLPALVVDGTLKFSGISSPVGHASVQVLCTACSGLDRTRPLAEGSSNAEGAFAVAVFDPGTM